jgi:hypothetical protein
VTGVQTCALPIWSASPRSYYDNAVHFIKKFVIPEGLIGNPVLKIIRINHIPDRNIRG